MNYSSKAKREKFIRQLRPRASRIKPMVTGEINNVVLVDDEVFRFPKTQQGKQLILYEAVVLGKLVGKITLPISKVHEVADDGSYIVFSYVSGQMLSSEEIIALNDEQKKRLARAIATCIREVNDALTVQETRQLQKQYIPWFENEEEYYKTKLNQHAGAKYHSLYTAYYEKFIRRRTEVGVPKEFVVYGDFHYGNMLFNEKNELSGLIDFGDLGVGTAVGELRQLYRLGQDFVMDVISELRGDFGNMDIGLIKLNAIMHEISVLMRPESQPPRINPRAELAKRLLSQWLGKNWGEL